MYDTNMITRFKAESVVLQKMKEMHTHVQAIFCDKSIGSRFHLNVSVLASISNSTTEGHKLSADFLSCLA